MGGERKKYYSVKKKKKERNLVIYNVNKSWGYHAKWRGQAEKEKYQLSDFNYMWNLKRKTKHNADSYKTQIGELLEQRGEEGDKWVKGIKGDKLPVVK